MQREVMDEEKRTWTCVQAYAGLGMTGPAAERAEATGEPVTVVCTPSGGAQTVRLSLAPDWSTAMSDDALLEAIMSERGEAPAGRGVAS